MKTRLLHTSSFILYPFAFILLATAFAGEPFSVTLDNGLRVVVIEEARSPIVTVRVFVGAGSMYERSRMGSGISHLTEHLVAGGPTGKRSEEKGKALLASIGGQSNAYTTQDRTCYHVTTLPRHLETALDLMSDWVMNASIPRSKFNREMAVVKQEVGTRRIQPETLLHQTLLENMFTTHPFRLRVIGYEGVLSRIQRDDVLDYYRTMYVPNNMLLVIAGDVSAEQTIEKAKKFFGPFPRGPQPDLTLPQEPPQLAERKIVQNQPVAAAYLMMGFRTIPISDPDLYALDLADYVLTRGNGSRLVRKLRDEQQLVETVSSWSYTPGWDTGNFVIAAIADPAKTEAAQAAILREVESLTQTAPSVEEITRAKKQKLADNFMALETAENRAENVASDILQAGDARFSDLYVQRIQSVTPEQVRAVVAKYLRRDSLTTVCFLPGAPKQEETPKAEASANSAVRKMPLKNGMRVLLRRSPEPALVSVQAYFMGGVLVESDANNGVCRLTADMLLRGTTTRTADQIARALDAMGATLSAASGSNTFYLSGECLNDDLPAFTEIFADVLCNPVFDQAEFEKRRDLQLADLKREKDDLHDTTMRLLRSKLFPGNAYRLMSTGSIGSVQSLKRDDVVAFHRRYCVPNNAVIAVFGDIEPDKVAALLDERFARFQPNPNLKLPPPARPVATDKDLRFEETGDKEKTMAYIAYPGMTVGDAHDRAAMYLADSVLSGVRMPSGRIFDELRGKGLVYDSHAINWVGVDPGFFAIYAVTDPNTVEDAIEIIRKHVARIRTRPVGKNELELARDNCMIALAMEMETNGEQAADAALNELYGLGYDFTQKYLQSLATITSDDVMQVARKYLTHSVTVVVGPALSGVEGPASAGADGN